MSSPAAPIQERTHKRALRGGFAALVGTSIEWYDFYIYATAAAIIFPHVFFPEDLDPALATLASFGTYAVAFFMRPLGGIIFGHMGDKLGRKPALTITLILMGVATTLVGLLPSYGSIGMWAPVLLILCRMVQGLAVGGEWGGASLMAVESAPDKWKNFYGGFTQVGNPLGALMATGAFLLLGSFGNDFLLDWGWRLPFIASITLVVVGLWIRKGLDETPAFRKARESGSTAKVPLKDTLRDHWRSVLIAIGATFAYLLHKMMRPRDALLGRVPGRDGFYKLHRHPEARPVPGLVIPLVQGDLLFFDADHVQGRLCAIADAMPPDTRWFVLDASAITQVDTTAAAMLEEVRADLAERGAAFGLAELHAEVRDLLDRAGLLAAIGPGMIFDDLDDALRAFEASQEEAHEQEEQEEGRGVGGARPEGGAQGPQPRL